MWLTPPAGDAGRHRARAAVQLDLGLRHGVGDQSAFPTSRTWDESQKDRSTVSGLGFRHELGRVMTEIGYTYSSGRTSVTYDYNAAALGVNATQVALADSGFPDLVFQQHLAEANATVPIVKGWSLRVLYRYERAEIRDWHYDGIEQNTMPANNSAYLDFGPQKYKVHFFGVLFRTSCDSALKEGRGGLEPASLKLKPALRLGLLPCGDSSTFVGDEPGSGFVGALGTGHSARRACCLPHLSWAGSGSRGTASRSAGDPEGERAARRVPCQATARVQGRQAQERSDGANAREDQRAAAPGTGRAPRQSGTGAARRAELRGGRTRSRVRQGTRPCRRVSAAIYPTAWAPAIRAWPAAAACRKQQLMNFKQGARTNDRARVCAASPAT